MPTQPIRDQSKVRKSTIISVRPIQYNDIRDETSKEKELRERALAELERTKQERFEKILSMRRQIDGFSK